jgi:membrane-associated PAP2 superfamily phosphatase
VPVVSRPRAAAAALALAAGVALLLPWERIDPAVSRLFYRPEFPHGPWQPAAPYPWGALAQMTTLLAIALALTGVALLIAALWGRGRPSARPALLILLGLALGPGLLVNVLLKDHWHRPRPRQTLGLGGDFTYVAPFRIGPVGKSFPCGHSAVGFACVALAAVVDERRRRARPVVVGGALALGALLGLGRVATGAHFASDVLWSGILTCGTVFLVDRALRFLPSRPPDAAEARRSHRTGRLLVAGGVVAVAALASALLCFPFLRAAAPHTFPIPSGPTAKLDVRIEVGHAQLVIVPPGEAVLTVESRHDGFGAPWGRIDESMHADPAERTGLARPLETAVHYRLAPRGWFADLEGTTILRLPAGTVGRAEITVVDGHLTLDDESGGAALPAIVCRIRRDALRLRGNLRRDQIEVVER